MTKSLMADPAPVIIFGHLDAITVLSRGLASKGIYPAELQDLAT